MNEVTAGPSSRLENNMFKPVGTLVKENFKNIDQKLCK